MKTFKFINPATKFTRNHSNKIVSLFRRNIRKYVLFRLSRRIIAKSSDPLVVAAHDLSNTDIYDFGSKRESLKKWENELGIVKSDFIKTRGF